MSDSKKYYAIGVMSGSSLDGLDVVYSRFDFIDNKWSFEIIREAVYDISCWENRLSQARNLSEENLLKLDIAFGGFIGESVQNFIKENNITTLDIISSHGHTVFHFPEKGITKQIGVGSKIFEATNIPVLYNLRQKDMDKGGQGAPIVPIGDLHLFQDFKYCLNIGGIANISIKNKDKITAFDICTANQVLNYFAFLKGEKYDDKGKMARSGKFNQSLFDELNTLEFYKKSFPKSLDNLFTQEVLQIIKPYEISIEDKLNTYCAHIAFQIVECINDTNAEEEILITGGGAFNDFLIEQISIYLAPKNIIVHIPSSEIINNKEALVMAFMGVLYLRNENNCLASVTGADSDTISGEFVDGETASL